MAKDIFGNEIEQVAISRKKSATSGAAKPAHHVDVARNTDPKKNNAVPAPIATPTFAKPEITEREQADMVRFAEMQAYQIEAPTYQKPIERLFYVTGSEGFKTITNTVTAFDGDQAFDVAAKAWPSVHWYCAAPIVGSVPVVSDNFYRVLGWYQLFSSISDVQLMALAHIFASGQGVTLQDQLEAYAKGNNLYTVGTQTELIEYIRKAYEINTGYIHPEHLQEHQNVGAQVLNPDLIPF